MMSLVDVDSVALATFPLVEVVEEEGRAKRVKRSEMDFSCCNGGRRICTSGSRQRGSWMLATEAGARTVTGMDWEIVVSRSEEGKGVVVVLLVVIGAGPSAKEMESSSFAGF